MNKLLTLLVTPLLICMSCQTKNNLFEAHKNDEVVEIVLSNYGLEEIPGEIGTLKNVKQLTLLKDSSKGWVIYPPMSAFSNRELTPPFYSLPKEITELQQLESLTIIGLNIHSLPENFEKLENLKQLNLSLNKLTLSNEVEKIVRLKKLKTLSLFGNKIDSAGLRFIKQERPDIQLFGLEDFTPTTSESH